MFIDIRSVTVRTLIIIDIDKDIYYRLYISPDNKEDVYSAGMLKYYIDRFVYVHYPVVI